MVNKKTSPVKNNIPFYVKHKYWVFAGIFLVLYYVLFAHNKVDLNDFTAKDLEIKTIETKEDFEDIIVKNIYDKIVESCEQNNNSNNRYYGDVDVMPMGERRSNGIRFGSNKVSPELKGSADMGSDIGFGIFGNSKSADYATSVGEVPATEAIAQETTAIAPSMDFDGNNNIFEEKSEEVTYSKTNIQKLDVDEGDILKQTKDYIFYFSKIRSKIFIIKSPLNGDKIDINKVAIEFTINIPSNLTLNPELFINDNKLVYIASKIAYNNHNTIVGIYDISHLANKEVKLHKIFETKGEYFKSRLVNNKLYLISDYSISPFASKYCNIINNKDNSSSLGDFISFFTGIKIKGFGLNKELFDELKTELESYSYKFNSEDLNSNGNISELSKFKLFYTNKDLKESIENLNFNVVSTIDVENKEQSDSQTLFFGNLKNGEIHMTLDNLYLVNSYYKPEKWKCDYIDICYKEFASNNFTSVSKISYSGNDLKYESTGIVPGKPLNQYSMDEDEGYFRIFTSAGFGDRDASLYVFDKKLKIIGQIENIKPGEEFKSARFIGDKAFLVTFRQIDPLFVIDLHIPSEPKIIGELEIPGYSTYLHPYGKVGNKDYLIGLGKQNNNVKVDLYEINYDIKNIGDQIEVNQKYSYVFTGAYSGTPAETNPRAFVWDEKDKNLYLPMIITDKNLYTSNDCINSDKPCYTGRDDFIGLKVLNIQTDSNIKEIQSNNTTFGVDMSISRVGYYKNINDITSFYIAGDFIVYFKKGLKDKIILY